MKLQFTFVHLDRSEALEQYAVEQLQEASRFLLKDGHGHVHLSKNNHEFCVEISLNTRLKYYKASALHDDPYQAVSMMVAKLERQFLKTKDLHQNHKHPQLAKGTNSVRYKKAA